MSPGTLEADIERAALDLFEELGWSTADVMEEVLGAQGTLGREHRGEVVLLRRLRPALEKLNPGVASAALDQALDAIVRDRSAMSLVQANREVYRLLKDGIPVRAALSAEES